MTNTSESTSSRTTANGITAGHISCLIQAGGHAVGHEQELARRLQQHHLAHYPTDDPSVVWRVVEQGRMFTAGEQSSTTAVSCSIDGVTSRDGREMYMRGICDLWIEVTGCSEHEVLVSITEIEAQPATTGQE
jgi:hypothetical protein